MRVWELVKKLEEQTGGYESIETLGQLEATMMVNYGPSGNCRPGIISNNETPLQKLVKICEYYEEELKKRGG